MLAIFKIISLTDSTLPQTRRYTTLWNIDVQKKQKQSEVCYVIYDILQGIVATRFRCGETSD